MPESKIPNPFPFPDELDLIRELASVVSMNKDEAVETLSQRIDHAISVMRDCKAELQILDLDAAIFLLSQVHDRRQATQPLNVMAIHDLASALAIRFIYTDEIHNLVESFTLREKLWNEHQGARFRDSAIRGQDHGDTDNMIKIANRTLTRFRRSMPMDIIIPVVFVLTISLDVLPATHPKRFAVLMTLADASYAWFLCTDDVDKLNSAISSLEDALICGPEGDSEISGTRHRICIMLAARFDATKRMHHLQRAISRYRSMNIIETGAEKHGVELLGFAVKVQQQFDASGDTNHLNTAISFYRQAVAKIAPSSEGHFNALVNLSAALWSRFMKGGQQIDLHEAIDVSKRALGLQSLPHVDRSVPLNNLANALWTRFMQDGQPIDLSEAIASNRQNLELQPLSHPTRALTLTNLANALGTRFEHRLGQITDLNEAISFNREALEIRAGSHPLRSKSLNNLANALRIRFDHAGDQSDLDLSISLSRQALELRPHPHPFRSSTLNNLANALHTKFHHEHQRILLDEAISLYRETLILRPAPNPLRSKSLDNLASALSTRFDEGGHAGDLDESISLHREALKLGSPTHPLRRLSLSGLADVLLHRFQRDGVRTDLDDAISLRKQVLDLKPSDPGSLYNLASALLVRFEQGGDADLDQAVSLFRQAIKLQAPTHPHRSSSLSGLAKALGIRFERNGDRVDLDDAISLNKQSLELEPSSHAGRSRSLFLSAVLLVHAHSLTGKYLEQAMTAYRDATQCLSQSASLRLRIANSWIFHAQEYQDISAIEAYEVALQALPQVVALSFDIQSRLEALNIENAFSLARRASRCALLAGNLEKAIEFLEAGRSVFWSQVLSLRSPVDQLHDINPNLADKLKMVGEALELGSHRNTSAELSDNLKRLTLDQETSRLNRLNEEWEEAIKEARKLKGFEDFLRSPRISSLKPAVSGCTVVILVANDNCSDCLIMTSTRIEHISLPRLHNGALLCLSNLIQTAISQLPISSSLVDQAGDRIVELLGKERAGKVSNGPLASSDDIFKAVLRTLWVEVIKPIVNLLDIKKSSETPQHMVQWCTTGLFTFLPIHAAGCYDNERAVECASDYFVSSYTPTIGALLGRPPVRPTQKLKMMVVIQSSELKSTEKELEIIRNHVSSDSLIEFGTPGNPAEVEAVAHRLPDASIVHFACHGQQDRLKPLDSALKLDDGLLRVSRIMKEKMQNGSLAFLCACETARGDQKLPDEAMSLAASLLFSGFRHVIGTMWQIADKDGPTIAGALYEELFRGPDGNPALQPDMTKSALALHIAVQKLRAENTSFLHWVPFIHIGENSLRAALR